MSAHVLVCVAFLAGAGSLGAYWAARVLRDPNAVTPLIMLPLALFATVLWIALLSMALASPMTTGSP